MEQIQELIALIEQIEKQLKPLSTTTLKPTKLNEIKNNLSVMQEKLKEINNQTLLHIPSCPDFSNNIAQLQTQAQQALTELSKYSPNPTLKSDLTRIKDQIKTLQNQLSILQTNINSNLENINANFLTLDANVVQMQDELAQSNANLLTINTSLGEQQTNIINMQTTHTNLQTTQSNQSSSLNSITTRLTKCENNVSTLTGGIEIGELDDRISNIESTQGMPCAHETYNFHNATPTNKTLYSREYYYSCNKDHPVNQELKLTYQSTGEGTLTIEIYESQVATGETFTVDLAQHPYEYKFTRTFLPTKMANDIMIKAVATTTITYKTLDFWLFGKNVEIYNYDQDVKVVVFDGNIYITRYYDNCVKYGKFTDPADIDIDNLPNSKAYHSNTGFFTYEIYMPKSSYTNDTYKVNYEDTFLCEPVEHTRYSSFYTPDDNGDMRFIGYTNTRFCGGDVIGLSYPYDIMPVIRNSAPFMLGVNVAVNGVTHDNLSNLINGEWIYTSSLHKNDSYSGEKYLNFNYLKSISKHENGNFYLISSRYSYQLIELCKGGISATGFTDKSNEIRIYINFGKYIKKFIATPNSSSLHFLTCEYCGIIENCSCIYELPNNYLLKKQGKSWILEPSENI